MTIDFRNAIELEICADCSTLEETGDATGFDYYYTEPESTRRITECEEGWAALRAQGDVFNDTTDDVQRMCSDCGHVGEDNDFPPYRNVDDDLVHLCPACGSEDTDQRSGGFDEFSWSSCDCCRSFLGGSRTRYALFPCATAPPPAGEAGPVVPEQVAGQA